jgi:hypothetical protein
MKTIQTILIILLSLTLHSQNKPFQIFLFQDTVVVNRIDTAFFYSSDKGDFHYENGTLKIIQNQGRITKNFNAKIIGFRKDSLCKLPIAEMVTEGRLTNVDNDSKKVILEGNFVKGKRVGVWHDRSDKFDIINVYDSTGKKLPLVKYNIDTSHQLIFINEIDTSTFNYSLKGQINLIINPINYFKSKSKYIDSFDTLRFCILNSYMDTLGYESWKSTDYDFIRFVWFRAHNPINLSLKKHDSNISFNLLVTDAEYDFYLGNVVQKDTLINSDTKEFDKASMELDEINFWGQISKEECYGDYLFIEAKIDGKYNSERINHREYRMPENNKVMKLFKKLSEKAGLKSDYRIKY